MAFSNFFWVCSVSDDHDSPSCKTVIMDPEGAKFGRGNVHIILFVNLFPKF